MLKKTFELFKKRKKVQAGIGSYVKAETEDGEVTGVLIPFRGKEMVETRSGIEDIKQVTGVTSTQDLGEDTQHFVKAVRRRHDLV
ncbi:MAG TPA: hypothetical protein VH593_18830 [Ktedonobacteraceae bacterium]